MAQANIPSAPSSRSGFVSGLLARLAPVPAIKDVSPEPTPKRAKVAPATPKAVEAPAPVQPPAKEADDEDGDGDDDEQVILRKAAKILKSHSMQKIVLHFYKGCCAYCVCNTIACVYRLVFARARRNVCQGLFRCSASGNLMVIFATFAKN